jgi:hypothetical protein
MMFTGDYACAAAGSSSSGSRLCFAPGGVNAAAAACLKGNPQCRAFAYNRADGGGYLKSADGVASPTPGSDLYTRLQ